MSVLLNPDLNVKRSALEDTPEVKSYIYQQISEFEPFITPETVVSVISKDPEKLIPKYEAEDIEFDAENLKTQYRIAISLKEGGAKLAAEGMDKNIFIAIRLAKESLMQKLMQIQDSVVTQQERNMAVYHALQNTMIH